MKSFRLFQANTRSRISCFSGGEKDVPWRQSFYQRYKFPLTKGWPRTFSSNNIASKNNLRVLPTHSKQVKSETAEFLGEPQASTLKLNSILGENDTLTKSWTNPNSQKRNTDNPTNVNNVMDSWITPLPEVQFPYSQHPSRNSSTTPREIIVSKIKSSELLTKAIGKLNHLDKVCVDWGLMRLDQEKISQAIEKSNMAKQKLTRQPLNLSPSSGRIVHISEKTNLIKAFRQVEITCNRNRIRRQANAQRFHERPGLKRKRLKSLRWRQRFLDGFKAVVNRVQELRSQGW